MRKSRKNGKSRKLLLDVKCRQPLDKLSRRLIGKSPKRLLAIANKMLGETLIELQPEKHTVIDDRIPAEFVGRTKALKPTWVSRA